MAPDGSGYIHHKICDPELCGQVLCSTPSPGLYSNTFFDSFNMIYFLWISYCGSDKNDDRHKASKGSLSLSTNVSFSFCWNFANGFLPQTSFDKEHDDRNEEWNQCYQGDY